jgi:hypothetical protein
MKGSEVKLMSSSCKRMFVLAAAAASLSFLTAPQGVAAPVGTGFTYQGRLKSTGNPLTGMCNFQFKLFDADGNQIGGPGNTQTVNNVSVVDGLFSVTIDFGAGAFDGNGRWLEIHVQGPGDPGFTMLAPRQPITPAPYAVHALNNAAGLALPFTGAATNQGSTSNGIDALAGVGAFNATNNAATGLSHGIMGKTSSSWHNATGVLGVGLATSGLTSGVQGYATASPSGTGVVGVGQGRGGWFESTAAGSYAVEGVGVLRGVSGSSSGGDGVYGTGTNAGVYGVGTAYGVVGRSDNGFGLWGEYGIGFSPPSGTNAGVYGTSASTNWASAGVRGQGGAGFGVEGISGSGTGVKGESSTGWGVYGRANGANGFGVYGHAIATGSNGVFGQAVATGSSGVLGRNESADGNGVFGFASGTATGVVGWSAGNDGVVGRTDAAGKSGVWAHTFNAAAYGGVFTNFGGGVALLAQGRAQVGILEITGADLIEKFEASGTALEPGTVAVIDAEGSGHVRASIQPYDPRVAGVVSGAGGIPHGNQLGQGSRLDGDTPLAMTGRVYVKCSAENGAIRPGDRLTTGSLAGHAMRATDAGRSPGAVIGKALGSLDHGIGLVLVLVNLQ